MEHFFCPNSGEDQKQKRSSPEMEHFFSQIQVDTYAQMHSCTPESNYWEGGVQMQTILKLLVGIQSNYWGDISPPGFGTPGRSQDF